MHNSRSTRPSTEAPSGLERMGGVAPSQGGAEKSRWFTEDTERVIRIDKLRSEAAEATRSRRIHLEFKELTFSHLSSLLKAAYPLDKNLPILDPSARTSITQEKSFSQGLIEATGKGTWSRTIRQLNA